MIRKIVIFISGRGSNMLAIAKEIESGVLKDLYEIIGVFSNNPNARGLELARERKIPTKSIDSNFFSSSEFDKLLLLYLKKCSLDYIILAGYNRLLSYNVVKRYEKKIINIHPADTNSYKGLHGYQWAFKKNKVKTMITIHWVEQGCDTGKIIAQKEVNLAGLNTLKEIQFAGLAIEHQFYSEVLKSI